MTSPHQIQEYLERTGQTLQELGAGGQAFGLSKIFNELVPQALKENKKIVWHDEPEKGIDAMTYSLEQI